jgi:ABC-type Zn uptake system ZnuABC Zn-binding protein ZnuA
LEDIQVTRRPAWSIVNVAVAFAMTTAASALLVPASGDAENTVTVVTTTEDLAAIGREVGGDRVSVQAMARGYQDPHFVDAKPSFILRLQKADLLVLVGRDLELGWLPPLLTQSRNSRIQPGALGYLDASLTARILEIPTGQITRAMGDVHPLGNPHYWLDPQNGIRVARAIADRLGSLRPDSRDYFDARFASFASRVNDAEKRWLTAMAPHKGFKVVSYHRSFANFAERFGLDVIGYIEPRPGIPPAPRHTAMLIEEMRRQSVKLILVEPYFDLKTPNAIARETGAAVVVMPPSVGGVPQASDYVALFDYNINLLVSTIAKAGTR